MIKAVLILWILYTLNAPTALIVFGWIDLVFAVIDWLA